MGVNPIMNQPLRRTTGARSKASVAGTRSLAAARRERREKEAEIARYIAGMTGELAAMATGARLDMIAWFLSLARLEAEMVTKQQIIDGLADRD